MSTDLYQAHNFDLDVDVSDLGDVPVGDVLPAGVGVPAMPAPAARPAKTARPKCNLNLAQYKQSRGLF